MYGRPHGNATPVYRTNTDTTFHYETKSCFGGFSTKISFLQQEILNLLMPLYLYHMLFSYSVHIGYSSSNDRALLYLYGVTVPYSIYDIKHLFASKDCLTSTISSSIYILCTVT